MSTITKRTTVTVTVDDLNGLEGATKFEFSIQGEKYALDLTSSNQARFRSLVSQFTSKASKPAPVRKHRAKVASTPAKRSALEAMVPEHRERNARIAVQVQSILSNFPSTSLHKACAQVGQTYNLTGIRISQIFAAVPFVEAQKYLRTHP